MLGDKVEYPSFVRLNVPDSLLFRMAGKVFRYFGFTTFDMWGRRVGSWAELMSSTTEEFTSQAVRMANLVLEPFPYTLGAPGSEQDREVMKIRGMDPSLSKRKQGNMDTNIRAALDFNAHAHQTAMVGDCALYDIFHYFGMPGLIGGGHLWS